MRNLKILDRFDDTSKAILGGLLLELIESFPSLTISRRNDSFDVPGFIMKQKRGEVEFKFLLDKERVGFSYRYKCRNWHGSGSRPASIVDGTVYVDWYKDVLNMMNRTLGDVDKFPRRRNMGRDAKGAGLSCTQAVTGSLPVRST